MASATSARSTRASNRTTNAALMTHPANGRARPGRLSFAAMGRIRDHAGEIGALVAVAFGAVVLSLAIVVFIGSSGFGYDYAAYDAAARRIVAGQPLYLADTAARYAAGAYEGLYLYPPPLAVALTPLTALPVADATIAWMVLRVVLLAGACWILPVARTARLLTFAAACLSFPVLFDLNIGNVSLVVFALTALAWRTTGTAVGAVAHAVLIAVRFPFGVFFLEWAVLRRWRPIAWTVAAGIGLIAASLAIVGVGTYVDYVTILRALPDISTGPHNLSLKSTALALGLPDGLAALTVPGGYVLGLAAIAFAARRRDADVAFVVTAVATLIVAPFIHPHYLVLLLLPAALLLDRGFHLAFLLPLAGWLPDPVLPLVAPVTLALLLAVPDRRVIPAPVPAREFVPAASPT